MGDILSALGGWISSLFGLEIVPGISFGGFFLLTLIIGGIGIILRVFWGGDAN